jgi:fused signal recognition particle receptor
MGAVFDQVWEIVAVCVVVAVVLVAGVVGLVRGRSSRQRQLTPPPAPPKPAPTTAPPTDLDSDADGRGVDTLPAPTRPAEPEVEDEVLVEEVPTLERPTSARGRLARLRARLARSNTAIGNALLVLLSRGGLDEEAWEEVEDTLIRADLGVEATTELVDKLRTKVKVDGSGATSEAEVKAWLKADLLDLVDPEMDRRIASSRIDGRPAVILVVGVNGTGKTTTVGKLARVLVSEDRDVILGAADTFRAAAADQLET